MIEVIERLKLAIKKLEEEHGRLLICALFLRADALEKWDIVLAASWLNAKKMDSYEVLSSALKKFLTDSDLVQFSRIVILEQDDPIISYLLDLETVKNGGYKELSGDILTGKFRFVIKKAYLLRSQKTDVR